MPHKVLEIMFDDLNEDAQKEFLEFHGLSCASEGNYEFFPIMSFDSRDLEPPLIAQRVTRETNRRPVDDT